MTNYSETETMNCSKAGLGHTYSLEDQEPTHSTSDFTCAREEYEAGNYIVIEQE